MTLSKEQIMAEALKLEPAEREALAEELLLSVTAAEQDKIDAAWVAEAERREAEFRAGRMTASSVDEAIARIQRRAR